MAEGALESAGIRLAVSGVVVGSLGLGIRLTHPADIGWAGALVALLWGGCAIATGIGAIRGHAWGARGGIALLGIAILAMMLLAVKVARGPDKWGGLAALAICAAALGTALGGLAKAAARGLAARIERAWPAVR